MPGRPRQTAIRAWLKSQCGKGVTPLDYVCERLASGDYLADISREIEEATALEIPQHALRRWLIDEFGKEGVMQRFLEAREDAADAYVAKAWHILDSAPEVREALDKAKAKADFLKWQASMANKAQYGSAPAAVNVNVNLASLHLDALRQRKQTASAVVAAPAVELLPLPAEED